MKKISAIKPAVFKIAKTVVNNVCVMWISDIFVTKIIPVNKNLTIMIVRMCYKCKSATLRS